MAEPQAKRSVFRPLAAPAAALIVTALLWAAGSVARLDQAWFDGLQRWFAPQAPIPANTAFVLVDEQSLAALGEQMGMRWPWPRDAFSAMFAGLHRAGARDIVADFIFFEPSEAAEQDMLLGAVAAGLPEVTLGAMRESDTGALKLPVVWPEEMRAAHAGLFASRPRWGLVDSTRDPDSVIRRYPRGASLAEAAHDVPATPDRSPPALLRWRGNLRQLRERGVPALPAAPFVAAGWEMLQSATEAAPDFDPAAMVRAIDAAPPPEGEVFDIVRGRTVFVGVNAAGTFDAVATPCGAPEPGVIVHWTAWASLEAGDFLADAGPAASAALLLVALLAIAWTGRGDAGLRPPGLATLGAIVAAVGGSAAAFPFGLWFSPALPAVGAAAAFSAVAVDSFRRERARKREIQGWFGSYVSPEVVKRLLRDPDSLRLGGERRDLTVFFSDLAGFTTLSEKMPPDRLVRLVNLFLEELSESVLRHGAYLDKYIGDSIMAVFGSPEELDNHALAACRAALDSQRTLAALNDRIEREHGVRLGMRIGINTGEVVVGNVGSARKRNYTVLGDAVNLASRLEGANKEFATSILIGPLTATRVAGRLATRPVAHLRVKGKAQAVEVHELIGEPPAPGSPEGRFLDGYRAGYAAFCARDFAAATDAFEIAAGLRPDDPSTHRYLTEARRLAAHPPPADWQPVLILESK